MQIRRRDHLFFELLDQIVGRVVLSDPVQIAVELGEDLEVDPRRWLSAAFEQSCTPVRHLRQLFPLTGAPSAKIAGQDAVTLLDQGMTGRCRACSTQPAARASGWSPSP